MSQLIPFEFNGKAVRVVTDDKGEPWFVAADVCAAISINTEQTRRLDDDEKGLRTVQTLGGNQEMAVINESGLYSLVLTSRKPEAKQSPFQLPQTLSEALLLAGQLAAKKEAASGIFATCWSRQELKLRNSAHFARC